jgi:hypothetical protein
VFAWEHQERPLLAAYETALSMGPAREGRLQLVRRLLLPRRRSARPLEPAHEITPA